MEKFKLSENIDSNKVFIINRSELEGRFDPIFYASDLAKFNTDIFKSVLLKSIVKYFKSGFGVGKQEQTDVKNGIIQIRPTNIDENGFLKYDKNIYLPIDKNSVRIEVDDILFNNTNSQELVGKTAILKENKELTFSNHITIIRVRKDVILPDYLWIILNMYQRNRIFYSICTNWNNQSGIGLELLKKIKIPLPSLEIQQQIVDLYEKAYTEKQQKEAQAQRLLDSIDNYLLGELGITLPKEEEYLQQPINKDNSNSYNLDSDNPLVKNGRLFLTNLSEVTGQRWNSDYYLKYYSIFIQNISNKYDSILLDRITDCIFQGVGKKEVSYSNIKLLKVKNILKDNNIDYNDVEFLEKVPKHKILKINDIITPFIGEAIRLIKFSNHTNNKETFSVDNNTGVIRVNKFNNPEYICEYLNSSIGTVQINRLIGGGGVPFMGVNNFKKILICLPPLEKQNEIATYISQIRTEANLLMQQGKEILERAKQKVERMILGD